MSSNLSPGRSSGRQARVALLALLGSFAGTLAASDGTPDTANAFPAVAGYYEFFVYVSPGSPPEVAYAEQSCSGALISPKVVLTAAHCTAFNYTEDVGIRGFYDRAWVSFDTVATANDFRCFLVETGGPFTDLLVGDYACDPAMRTVPAPRFIATEVIGTVDGLPLAHGLTHPAYLRAELRPDGARAKRAVQNLKLAEDVGALILAERVDDRAPLPVRGLDELDSITGVVGTPVVSVGSGLNWTKLTGGPPTKGLGPMTDLGGGNGTKRVAQLGPITNLFENSLLPRQSVQKGDDTVCFGDSGSPLFLVRNGEVEQVISAVLSGATNWCQGSMDPYYRIDQPAAQDFIQCVIAHEDDASAACHACSSEAALGLCD